MTVMLAAGRPFRLVIGGAGEASARAQADARLGSDLGGRIDALGAEINAGLTRVEGELDAANRMMDLRAYSVAGRPGDTPQAYTLDVGDPPAGAPPIPVAYVAVSAEDGLVAHIAGGQTVTPALLVRLEPARAYEARFALRRRYVPTDPDNDAIRIGLQWLAADKVTEVGRTTTATFAALTPAMGRVARSVLVAADPAIPADTHAPAGTVYARPFVQAFGGDTPVEVEVLSLVDVTGADGALPDLAAFQQVLTETVAARDAAVAATAGKLDKAEFIQVSTDLHVPGDFATLKAAMDWLNARPILDPSALVRIMVADGTYTLAAGEVITPRHPQGAQVQIIGNQATPANVKFEVPAANSQSFIRVESGFELGLADGFTVESTGGWVAEGVWNDGNDGRPNVTPYGCAVLNFGGGVVHLGSAVRFEKMYYGVRSEAGGLVICDDGLTVNNAGDVGFHAFNGGHIVANRTTASNCSHAAVGQGGGFLAELGGTIQAEQATATGCSKAAFGAISNGVVWAENGKANHNTGIGFWCANGGHMIAVSAAGDNAVSEYNQIGVKAEDGSSLEFFSSISRNNVTDGVVSYAHSTIDVTAAQSVNNGGLGLWADGARIIGYGNTKAKGNGTNGAKATNGGSINLEFDGNDCSGNILANSFVDRMGSWTVGTDPTPQYLAAQREGGNDLFGLQRFRDPMGWEVGGAAGAYRWGRFSTQAGSPENPVFNARFDVGINEDPETGNDAGSNFYIGRLGDGGDTEQLGPGMTINRATAAVEIFGPLKGPGFDLSALITATSDADAAGQGVPVGFAYVNAGVVHRRQA